MNDRQPHDQRSKPVQFVHQLLAELEAEPPRLEFQVAETTRGGNVRAFIWMLNTADAAGRKLDGEFVRQLLREAAAGPAATKINSHRQRLELTLSELHQAVLAAQDEQIKQAPARARLHQRMIQDRPAPPDPETRPPGSF